MVRVLRIFLVAVFVIAAGNVWINNWDKSIEATIAASFLVYFALRLLWLEWYQ